MPLFTGEFGRGPSLYQDRLETGQDGLSSAMYFQRASLLLRDGRKIAENYLNHPMFPDPPYAPISDLAPFGYQSGQRGCQSYNLSSMKGSPASMQGEDGLRRYSKPRTGKGTNRGSRSMLPSPSQPPRISEKPISISPESGKISWGKSFHNMQLRIPRKTP